jgi:SHS2 domain-containing protein
VSYRWVEHTAELELELEGDDEAEVFSEALRAAGELISDGPAGEQVMRSVELEAADRAALLVAWLDELVYLAETEDLVPAGLRRIELGEQSLKAEVDFVRCSPRHLIKGATYHRLVFERHPPGYRATVVLDV